MRVLLGALCVLGPLTITSFVGAQPANDNCDTALTLLEGLTPFDSTGADTDGVDIDGVCPLPGDGFLHHNTWYCYTATAEGILSVSTLGSSDVCGCEFDTRLAAYDGCECPANTDRIITCNDDGHGFPPGESIISFSVIPGNSYLIEAGSWEQGIFGPGTLTTTLDPPQTNDNCADLVALIDGVTSFNNGVASNDGMELSSGPCAGTFTFGDEQIHNDLWYCYTAPCDGIVRIDAGPLDTRLAVYDGCGCPDDPGAAIACDDDSGPDLAARVSFPAVSGQSYLVRVGSFESDTAGPGEISIKCSTVPDNDDCANPTAIGDGVTAFNNTAATTDGLELLMGACADPPENLNIHNDLWYSYTASCDGTALIQASGFDTQVAVFNIFDCPADPLSLVACDDDGGGPEDDSHVVFDVSSGETFLIRVGGDTPTEFGTGSLTISCNPPLANDDCANATAIGDGVTAFDLTLATTDGPDLTGVCDFGDSGDETAHKDAWFCYTAPCNGSVTASTAGSGLDTRLAAFAGCSCPADPFFIIPNGCDDDGLGFPPGESVITFPVDAGESYLLQVGVFSEDTETGAGTLTVTCEPCVSPLNISCSYDCQAAVVNLSWTTGSPYDSIDIEANGVTIMAGLPGDTTDFVDAAPPAGDVAYNVIGNCTGGASVGTVCTTAVAVPGQDLILALETLGTIGVPQIDSGTALKGALEANGRTVAILRQEPLNYPCLVDIVDNAEILWVLTGTYPSDYRLSQDEADFLATSAGAGKGLYLESGDHWGFGHVDSLLDARDGIEPDLDPDECDNICDGDDTFDEMDGSNAVAAGLDLSGLQDVRYNQDQIGNDWNDQLSVSGTTPGAALDLEVVSAEVLWQNSPNAPADIVYITGVIAEHMDGTKMISQSWEIGGFGGDLNGLVEDYVEVLSPPEGTPFLRGDCNANGTFDGLGDGLAALNFQFVPGTPAPACLAACDANNNDSFDGLGDALRILNFQFVPGTPPPDAPYPSCGLDQTTVFAVGCGTQICP